MFAGFNRHWLYKEGNEFIDLTGGWSEATIHPTITINGTITKANNYIGVSLNTSSSRCSKAVATENLIDVSDYSTCIFTFINPSTGKYIIKEIDVSDDTGSYFAYFGLDVTATGINYGLSSNRSLLQNSGKYICYDQNYKGLTAVYLTSVELVP